MKTYKAISLKQPWANLVADGKKTIETRKWTTRYRGDLVICSSQKPSLDPAGCAIAIVEVYAIRPMQEKDEQQACCKVYPRAQSWFLRNIRKLDHPIPIKGRLGIFDLTLPRVT
jgi:hypothetical protein